MYEAFDSSLRVIYSQIIRQLRFVQLRDKDSFFLVNERDYELIQLMYTKYPTKINLPMHLGGINPNNLRCAKYRQYNVAYFEEVLIHYQAESRVAQNYRERFLTTPEALNLVLEMYCRNDYLAHFMNINLEEISHKQIVKMFATCIRYDALKIAMNLYLRYLENSDMDSKMMDIVIQSMNKSVEFHEIKLFFLHQHFDVLTIIQMNDVVDVYLKGLNQRDYA
jgi:hypothetical protein